MNESEFPDTGGGEPTAEQPTIEQPTAEQPTIEASPHNESVVPAPAAAISEPASPPVEVAPVRASRPGAVRWGIALLVTAAVVGVASAALYLASAGGSISRLADWAPPESYAYAEYRIDPPGDQGRRAGELLAHFPGFADQAQLDAKITEALDRYLAEASGGDVTFSSIKPWLGEAVAVAATRLPSPTEGSVPAVLIVATKDAEATRDWLASSITLEGTTTETYGDATLTVGTTHGTTHAYTVLDTVLLAGEESAVKAAIDTKGASTFPASEPFASAVSAIEGDPLAFGYVDARRFVEAALSWSPGAGLAEGLLLDRVPAWTSAQLTARSDALEVVVTSPALAGAPSATNEVSTLAPRLPADTVISFETRDLGTHLTSFVEGLRANEATKAAGDQLDDALGVLGGFDSFVAWMADASLAVTAADGAFSGGLVVATLDEDAAATKLAQLRSLLTLAGSSVGIAVNDQPYGDGVITTIDLGDLRDLARIAGPNGETPTVPSGDVELAYTVQDGLLVIGVGDEFVKAVIDTTPGDSLAAQAGYKAAIERAGESNAGQVYADIARLIDASIGFVPSEAQAKFDQEVKPFVDPLASFAGASIAGDPMRIRYVVTVK